MMSGCTPISSSFLMLCWVGLLFCSPVASDHGTMVTVDVHDVVASLVTDQLARGFDEVHVLDVADGAADLHQHHVVRPFLGLLAHEVFNFAGNVRHDLHVRPRYSPRRSLPRMRA